MDAIYFDQKDDVLFLVQSKWSDDGTKSLDADATNAMVNGVHDLLAGRFDRFNDKVRAKESEVTTFLYSERPIKISLVTAHTATQPIATFVKRKIDDLIDDLNDAVPIADGKHYDQAGIYGLITSESRPPKLKLQIGLKDWGVIEKAFLAYYGRVHVNEIRQWWQDHGNILFGQNLRLFYFTSEVNDALSRTLGIEPEFFWYFNNGITVICDSIIRAPVGAPGRLIGLFTCNGANIVNGAQTVGTIGRNGGVESSAGETDVPEAWVQVRIISLEKCPPDFARAITRAANLQNAVGSREFAAMDPSQHRLAIEFSLDKRRYVYKQGEAAPTGNEGCDIVEATQALACANSAALAVQVKRGISTIWSDTNKPPYTDLFNERLTSTAVWRSVLTKRAVDDELHKLKESRVFNAYGVATHLNRLILHLVFQDSALKPLRHDAADEEACINAAREATKQAFVRVADYVERVHKENYLASLCKNLTKCDLLVQSLLAKTPPPDEAQGKLFE